MMRSFLHLDLVVSLVVVHSNSGCFVKEKQEHGRQALSNPVELSVEQAVEELLLAVCSSSPVSNDPHVRRISIAVVQALGESADRHGADLGRQRHPDLAATDLKVIIDLIVDQPGVRPARGLWPRCRGGCRGSPGFAAGRLAPT